MLQKTLDSIIVGLKFLGSVPASVFPDRLKGFRTIIFNLLTALLVVTESLDWSSFAEGTCALILWATNLAGIPWECSPDGVGATYVIVVGFLNMALRAITETPIGSRQSIADVKLIKAEEQLLLAVDNTRKAEDKTQEAVMNRKAVLEGNRLLIRKIEKLETELEAKLSNTPVRRRKPKNNGPRK